MDSPELVSLVQDMMQVPPPLDSDTSEPSAAAARYRVVQAPNPLPGEEGVLDLPDEQDFEGLLDDDPYLTDTYPSLFLQPSPQPRLPGAGTPRPALTEGPREPTGVGVGGGPRPYVGHKSPRRVAPAVSSSTPPGPSRVSSRASSRTSPGPSRASSRASDLSSPPPSGDNEGGGDKGGGGDGPNHQELRRVLQMLRDQESQRLEGRNIQAVTHTNTITTVYKDGRPPSVRRTSTRTSTPGNTPAPPPSPPPSPNPRRRRGPNIRTTRGPATIQRGILQRRRRRQRGRIA